MVFKWYLKEISGLIKIIGPVKEKNISSISSKILKLILFFCVRNFLGNN
jgi:hypothetical protein